MSMRVAVFGTQSLVAEQFFDLFDSHPVADQVTLSLFDSTEEAGRSLMIKGHSTPVRTFAHWDGEQADLVLLCSQLTETELSATGLAEPRKGCLVIDLRDQKISDGSPAVVAGINTEILDLGQGGIYRGADPFLMAASWLLKSWEPTGLNPLRVTSTLILPASAHDKPGVEALASETVHLLNGREAPSTLLETPLAFNLLARPEPAGLGEDLPVEARFASGLPQVLDPDLEVSASAVQAPLFHGSTLLFVIETQNVVERAQLVKALDRTNRFSMTEKAVASTQSVTGQNHYLITRLRYDSDDERVVKLTLMFDEQQLGRAANALDLLAGLIPHH